MYLSIFVIVVCVCYFCQSLVVYLLTTQRSSDGVFILYIVPNQSNQPIQSNQPNRSNQRTQPNQLNRSNRWSWRAAPARVTPQRPDSERERDRDRHMNDPFPSLL